MRLRLLSIPLAALLAVAVAGPGAAITNGTPDGTNHPYVGIIEIYTDVDGVPTPSWSCTGSLLSPTVVLTAAHCLSLVGDAVAARVWFAPELSGAPNPGTPYNGDPTSSGGIDATEWHVFPGWQAPPDPNDLAVVILSEPVPLGESMPRYAQLPTAGIADTLPNRTVLDLVGWGAQFQAKIPGSPFERWDGVLTRYYVPSELNPGNSSFTRAEDLLMISSAQGGICFGDSGGPDLLTGADTVIAVNYAGLNPNCAGNALATRLDLPEPLDWINGFLQ